jgi:hypothetical protein
MFHVGFISWLTFQTWRWRRYVSPKRQLTSSRLYVTISHKTEIVIHFYLFSSLPRRKCQDNSHFDMLVAIYKTVRCHNPGQKTTIWKRSNIGLSIDFTTYFGGGTDCKAVWQVFLKFGFHTLKWYGQSIMTGKQTRIGKQVTVAYLKMQYCEVLE